MTSLKPIRTEEEYELALARIAEGWEAAPGTAAADELEALSILVEAYEKDVHPIPPPDPIDALRFAMEQRGLRSKDLESMIGPSGRVSEVLRKRRALTLPMIRKLHSGLGVEPETLIRPYRLVRAGKGRSPATDGPPRGRRVKPKIGARRSPATTRGKKRPGSGPRARPAQKG
jgi:HTH-type transcriptional regulator/antitoxin HigA